MSLIIPKSRQTLDKIERLRKPGKLVEHFTFRKAHRLPTIQQQGGLELFVQRFRVQRLHQDELESKRLLVGQQNEKRIKDALERTRPAFSEAMKTISLVASTLKEDTSLDFAMRNDEKYIEENIFGLHILNKKIVSWEMFAEESLLGLRGFKAHVYAVVLLAVVSGRAITALDTEPWEDDARVVMGVYGGFGTDLPLSEPGFKFRLIDPCDPMDFQPSVLAEAMAGAMATAEDALAACFRHAKGLWVGTKPPEFVGVDGTHPIIKSAENAASKTYKDVKAYLDAQKQA